MRLGAAARLRAVLARGGPALLGLALGVLALGPALGPGFALRYDMVFVPEPPLRLGDGFPRAVPSDQVVALLSALLPAEIVQKAILLGLFALAASGAGALARDALAPRAPGDDAARGPDVRAVAGAGAGFAVGPGAGEAGARREMGVLVPSLAAAAFYAWNAYLAQRLLIGQWALLLGYAGLPWAVRAAARGGTVRLAAALLPAAVGGFQAMLVSALTVLPVAALRRLPAHRPEPPDHAKERPVEPGAARSARARGCRRAVLSSALSSAVPSLGVVVVLSLPWLVPALVLVLRADAAADPAGVAAFAPRADGPFGTLGSLLTLGGIWNSHAVVPGQDMPALAAVRLALTLVAVTGFVRLGFVRRPAWWPGLAAAACAGVLIACAGAFAPGVPRALIGWWAGFGPLRDGQVYVAPFALALAVGVAMAVTALRAAMPAPVAAAAVAVPVLVLPTFALGAFGRLGTAGYPEEWRRVQAVVNGDPAPGALLSLPWSAYRAFSWNGGRVVLDPATKMFARPVVWNDALVVGTGGGRQIRVAPESPRARRIGALLAGPATSPLTGALTREGVRYVLAGGVDENTFLSRLPGATPVYRGRELLLVRL
ncbi:hypothetical protein [Microbispora sitophila]|uniref:hypothetical protein n=1 Tax=Microbispora sitophila TaxID=2771537 RepID=UPI001868BCC7|nr:hypothetical protein [Microbispora sitophila]